MSALLIDLPDSLHDRLRDFAAAEGVSVEQLIASAAAEKLSALLEGADYLRREGTSGSRAEFERIIAKVPDAPPEPFDALE